MLQLHQDMAHPGQVGGLARLGALDNCDGWLLVLVFLPPPHMLQPPPPAPAAKEGTKDGSAKGGGKDGAKEGGAAAPANGAKQPAESQETTANGPSEAEKEQPAASE
uniref:Uncharacterized protein n=1 Tax=Zea mays TaxID=4577 RepID=B4FJS8_MAIZE|nr:unknown [Zea mays]